jgi:hypothetical protein
MRKHVRQETHEVFRSGELVYKRTKVDTELLFEQLALIVEREVDRSVDLIVQQIDQQDTSVRLAPGVTFVPDVSWQDESVRHAAELKREMENLKADFREPPSASSFDDEIQRLNVLDWLELLKSRADLWKAPVDTFAACALQVHNNLNTHSKLHQKLNPRTRNFTPTMLRGLSDLEAYRKLYARVRQQTDPSQMRQFLDEFGVLAEVELVAKTISEPCAACRSDPAYPWALFRNLDSFTMLCDVDSREKGSKAWRSMQEFMYGDLTSAMDVLRSAHIVAGGEVPGPVSLLRLQEDSPSHFALWSSDANRMRYWAELHTQEGPIFLPTAVALRRWPYLRNQVLDTIRRTEYARIEPEERRKVEQLAIQADES